MYYAHFILNKKGPLAKIWLAAHWDKKLTKAQIYETNIESTIEAILEPQMKLALRTSGHLLLGICRIYSRKVKYLLADCNEAFVKIKLAFRPGLIDLPKEKQQAEAITLPDKFPEMSAFADINMDAMDVELALGTKSMGSLATQVARIEDITLKEDMYGTGGVGMVTMQDDDFGDMGMGMGLGLGGAHSMAGGADGDTFMFSDIERGRHMTESMHAVDVDAAAGAGIGAAANDNNKSNLQKSNLKELSAMELGDLESNLENRTIERAAEDTIMHDMPDIDNNDIDMLGGKAAVVPTLFDEQPTVVNNANAEEEAVDKEAANQEGDEVAGKTVAAAAGAVEKQMRARRRQRKLIIDEVKEIDSATMKAQLGDTSSILGTLELAPPTRQLMLLKEIGGVDKLFSTTGRIVHNKAIAKLYTRNMTVKSLADITNTTRERARDHHKSMAGDDHSKHPLPLVDSYIDAAGGGDASRLSNRGGGAGDDDYDNYAAPASVYNNQNLDDMLENPAMQVEMTPGKHKTAAASDSDSDSDEEGGGGGGTKTAKNKSSQKKRSYRKSLNLSQRGGDQSTLRDVDLDIDETTTDDPNKTLTKRAKTMVSLLNRSFNKQDNVSFFELIRRNGKKSVVQKFYSLLVLKKHEIIDVVQAHTYGDIIISRGDKFDTLTLS